MNQYPYETEEWERLEAEVDAEIAAEGGSTGSNMAETYIPPEAHKLWERLPQEKKDEYLALFRK